jgi:hypothetical protein
MRIISIDIGIRNLAVCVLEGTSRKDVKIKQWDVIDILGEKNGVNRPLCFHCSKAGMWFQGDKFACTKHCPKDRVPTKTSISKKKIEELRKQAVELKINPLPVKKPELVNAVYEKLKSSGWTKFVGGASVKHSPVLDLASDIVISLDNRREWWEETKTDLVVVENQKDRRMFAVQAMIHMYFATKGFKIKGVSAIHKLNNIMTLEDATGSYRGRKKTGIVHCEKLMPEFNRPFFKIHKKKDDLADSFLQGLWFLEHT